MITKKKYTVTEKNGIITTILEAQLRFKDEVAPINKEIIKNRMYEHLAAYFKTYENLKEPISYGPNYISINEFVKRVYLEKKPLKLGINIEVISYHKVSLEKMLNLENLNNFILTGECPEYPTK
jgi:hypothetical protein